MNSNRLPLIITLLFYSFGLQGQILDITAYRDTDLPRVELYPSHYDFIYPVNSDVLNVSNFTPPTDGRYYSQNYGPRYIIDYDNHQGLDIAGYQTIDGTLYPNPPVLSMCDGDIGYIKTTDTSPSGKTIRIRCDSSSTTFGTPVHIHYRHLDEFTDLALSAEGVPDYTVHVNKGDTIGYVGSTGASWTHLHLDYSGINPEWSSSRRYLNPNRLFDPTLHPHVTGVLDYATIELLHDWTDSTLFRIYWPHNQHINRFEFSNMDYNLVYDVEEVRASYAVYEPSIWARDSMNIFPYRYNGQSSANYYWSTVAYPAIFPASPLRDNDPATYGFTHIPILADSVVHVYDFILHDVPPSHLTSDWVVRLSDVWGYTVEGSINPTLPVNLKTFDCSLAEEGILLEWQTASESNNSGFEVLRSGDGHYWEELGFVEGQVNSNTIQYYRFVDRSGLRHSNYYKLRQIDLDGTSTYSKTLICNHSDNKFLKIYPNPSSTKITVQFDNGKASRHLKVYNMVSRNLVLEEKIFMSGETLDVSSMEKGIYMIHIGNLRQRFVVH